jgi:superfamily I DNA/RNA helicase
MAAERRKQNINAKPRIKLSTIHGAKGGESDHVVLLTDLSYKAEEAYHKNPDDERRVFYVGMTRAKKSLHIVRSQSEREFKEIFI